MLYAQIYLFQEVSPQKLTHANDGEFCQFLRGFGGLNHYNIQNMFLDLPEMLLKNILIVD